MQREKSRTEASRPSVERNVSISGGSTLGRITSHNPISALRRLTSHKSIQKESDDELALWEDFPETRGARHDEEAKFSNQRSLGVTWKDLSVRTQSTELAFAETVASQFIPSFLRSKKSSAVAPMRTILDNSFGSVKPGETLLVLGRPGAGCTTLLKVLANRRTGYKEVEGDVHYGSMDHKEAARYRGQIIMDAEGETFFPTLTAGETIDFATRLKMPYKANYGYGSAEEARVAIRDFYFRMLGVSHTRDTKVGNEYIRGVSGGERRRISLLEAFAARGSVCMWDNSTRGLDANTALQFVQSVRTLTDLLGLSSIVTLYQASNSIYQLFDKVLVLEQGKQIFYGPMRQAKPFMEELGFICADGANVADYLTGVTVPTERRIRSEMKQNFPKTGADIRDAYQASDIKESMYAELDYPYTDVAKSNTEQFTQLIKTEKHPDLLTRASAVTAGFFQQFKASVIRQYQILQGDRTVLFIKQGSNIIQALSCGSLFYAAPDDSSGLFIRSGAIFVSIFFNALLAQSEVLDSFMGRPVLAKHRGYAYLHPAAWCLSQIAVDLPIQLVQISAFSLIIYFMVGLSATAEQFFIFWFLILTTTICITALFRAIGACFGTFDDASKVSGVMVMAVLMYCGYFIPKGEMKPWFVWIYWIDPIAYAFNAILSNELFGQTIPCVGLNLVPNGPGYTSALNQACTGVRGALPGATSLTGEQHLSSLSYSHSTIWRNVGIIWAWWALYVAITIFATSTWKDASSQSGVLVVPRDVTGKARLPGQKQIAHSDETSANSSKTELPTSESDTSLAKQQNEKPKIEDRLVENKSVFTWRNLTYTVDTPNGARRLLNDVHGWVKPGMLGALMGASGAGKTTLLDVLAQRKTDGTINGSILVDGKPLPLSFQRSAGYCEQLDVHEPLATVREALEFSALLRQSHETPREEKLAYVDVIIDLLEMHDLENCLVGNPGAQGLNVEQRKRLTIAVELVAKPSILIFLDEPTSGLDGQGAFNTVRFLKKLAAAGQAVLVTIHQPSAQLFYEFDTLLLLARGGNTVYFGDIGEQADTLKGYFSRNGAECPPNKNPAEFMIDVVSDRKRNWAQTWLESPEHESMLKELDHLVESTENMPSHFPENDSEFAAPLWEQTKVVTMRLNRAMYRNIGYVNNKFALHIITGLFTGFSFWQIGDSAGDLMLRMFAVFNFIFVAPGVIAQLQPLFIEKRDIYDTREKKSRIYSWKAFVTGLIVSELPYLMISGVLFFVTFYYTVGLPSASSRAGPTILVMLLYELLYTGIGQFIAAYASNATAASLINPLVIFTLVGFSGIVVPYSQLTEFWRYWLYYLNPFTYLIGSLLVFTTWNTPVNCKQGELAIFNPINGTCGEYLSEYLSTPLGSLANLLNPDATSQCEVCQYKSGSSWLATINRPEWYMGWRDTGIVALFCVSSYALVYGLMKLRTKKSKKAE